MIGRTQRTPRRNAPVLRCILDSSKICRPSFNHRSPYLFRLNPSRNMPRIRSMRRFSKAEYVLTTDVLTKPNMDQPIIAIARLRSQSPGISKDRPCASESICVLAFGCTGTIWCRGIRAHIPYACPSHIIQRWSTLASAHPCESGQG